MKVLRIAIVAAISVCISWASAEDPQMPSLQSVLSGFDDEHGDLLSVMVLQDGKLIANRFYNGADGRTLHDVRSAGKSVTSLLFGIALDQGAIKSLDDPVEKYWPETKGSSIGSKNVWSLVSIFRTAILLPASTATIGTVKPTQ